MQRQSADLPEIPRDRPPLRRSSPSSQGIGEQGRSRTALSPGPPGGGCKPPLKRTFFPRLVCSPRRSPTAPPWSRGSSPAARLAAPQACATFLGLCLARCSASDPELPLLPLARRPPCGTTNPYSKKKVFWKGSWCRAGAGSERPGTSEPIRPGARPASHGQVSACRGERGGARRGLNGPGGRAG